MTIEMVMKGPMSERTVSLAEAKARLSELIGSAQSDEDVVITKRGKAVARLVAEPAPRPSILAGCGKSPRA